MYTFNHDKQAAEKDERIPLDVLQRMRNLVRGRHQEHEECAEQRDPADVDMMYGLGEEEHQHSSEDEAQLEQERFVCTAEMYKCSIPRKGEGK